MNLCRPQVSHSDFNILSTRNCRRARNFCCDKPFQMKAFTYRSGSREQRRQPSPSGLDRTERFFEQVRFGKACGITLRKMGSQGLVGRDVTVEGDAVTCPRRRHGSEGSQGPERQDRHPSGCLDRKASGFVRKGMMRGPRLSTWRLLLVLNFRKS